ncbi:MAG TPA: adenylate cyclase [Solibacterales bacterium]|nr:adenylate cyclase [Bryobacterales bacterium]
MATGGGHETEIKLRATDVESALANLARAGFRVVRERHAEINLIYDRDGQLRAEGKLLRIRSAGGRTVVTFKGRAVEGKHKSRPEIEFTASSLDACRGVFESLGYTMVFRYDKWRTEFEDQSGEGMAVLDETPIGIFLELEGEPDWIDRTAARLGYREADFVTASYASLYLDDCRRRGVVAGHMVFEAGTADRKVLETPKGGA